MLVVNILLFIFYVWTIIVFVFSLLPMKCREQRNKTHIKEVVVVVPAHNEEKVIERMIESVKKAMATTPEIAVRLIIGADRCTDGTVEMARRQQVEVYERVTGLPGKQHLLKEIFTELLAEYGANPEILVTVLDADNRIESNYFAQLVYSLGQNEVVQGYIATLNCTDNLQTRWYATNYHFMLRSFYWGRERWNRSSVLGGTGWGIRLSILERVPFAVSSVSDDLEYSAMLRVEGIRISYNPKLICYDEKPQGIRTGIRQRLRWARGQWQVFFRYFHRLIRKDFEFSMYLAIPFATVLSIIPIFYYGYSIWGLLGSMGIVAIWAMLDRGFVALPGLLLHIPYLFIQFVLVFYALLTFRNHTWVRTPHGKKELVALGKVRS
ncbi:glycosyltransferase family 2 protein [Rubeoparvulum massiliense]|uniref:glycosyltransferase family 2 protein n=1 Tax=Rubeoparvulum massiliense TaxID=1631346 RepID=UPI00065DE522|nr:glycosyltransferase family 2 protein [Rubeoparvulum massiliense]